MTLRCMRLGMMAFLALTSALTANLMLFQPIDGRKEARRTVPASSDFASAGRPADIATGSLVILNATKIDAALPAKSGAPADVVRAIQRELQARGYETGTADGMPGLVTRAAILGYESDHGLSLTATPSEGLLQHILLGSSNGDKKKQDAPTAEASQVIRTVQQSLATLGYAPGSVDGQLGDQTVRAIREFEKDQGLSETGRISGALVARLARLAGQGRLADGR